MSKLPRPALTRAVLALLLVLLAAPSRPAATAEPEPVVSSVSVTGRVQLPGGATPAEDLLVAIAPRSASPGAGFDYGQATYAYTFSGGLFSLSVPAAGEYTLELNPPDSQPLLLATYANISVPAGGLDAGTLTLQSAPKVVSGTVSYAGSGAPVQDASVYIYQSSENSWRSRTVRTNASGAYQVGVSGGQWVIYPYPVGQEPWQFNGSPTTLSFAANSSPESQPNTNFSVAATTAQFVGQVLDPSGGALPSGGGANTNLYLYAWNPSTSSAGRIVYPDASGTFTIPVTAGEYTISLYISSSSSPYDSYDSPPNQTRSIQSGTVNLGQIRLLNKGGQISGRITDTATGSPLPNIEVTAFRDNGGYVSALTNGSGNYNLRVSDGSWELSVSLDAASPYLTPALGPPILISGTTTITRDISLTPAAVQVNGTAVDQAAPSEPLASLQGWAYARSATTGEYVAWDYLSAGRFRLNLTTGSWLVGLSLNPQSQYSILNEEPVAAALAGAAPPIRPAANERLLVIGADQPGLSATVRNLTIQLARNDATIQGVLRNSDGTPVTGIAGSVSAYPVDGQSQAYQYAYIDASTGGFSLPVSAGSWYLSYYLDLPPDSSSPYDPDSAESVIVDVSAGATVTQDLTALRLDGEISGTTLDENDNPLGNQYVWVSGNGFYDSTFSEADGSFSFAVPLGPNGQPLSYYLGGDFSCDATGCYLNQPPQLVVAEAASGAELANSVGGNIVRATKADRNIEVDGSVTIGGDGTSARVKVRRNGSNTYSDEVTSNAGGNFSNAELPVNVGVGASLSLKIYAYTGNSWRGESRPQSVTVSAAGLAQLDLAATLDELQLQTIAGMPEPLVQTFKAANGWTFTLSDGSRIEIPPGAVPLSASNVDVRVVVEPTVYMPPDSVFDEGASYGYIISLFEVDSQNSSSLTPISAALRTPARLTLAYKGDDIAANGAGPGELRPVQLNAGRYTQAGSFLLDTVNRQVIVSTTTLGHWGLMQTTVCQECLRLPLVRR